MKHRNWALIVLGAGLASACVPVGYDPGRDQIGVSVARPDAGNAAPDQASLALLDWKARQICTRGYGPVQQDIEPGEDGQQFIDWRFHCNYYTHVSLF